MAHSRSISLSSLSGLGSLTSTSSRASVESYKNLKPAIVNIEQSEIGLLDLVDKAENLIKKFSGHPQSTFTYTKDKKEASVNLDVVMSAMLASAEECGGESGKRYVASAIVACGQKGGDDVFEALAALGTTWLTHLLFIFKTSRRHKTQLHKEPSELATPTLDDTASHAGEGVSPRSDQFKNDLMLRDRYTCVVTGIQDDEHPVLDQTADLDPVTLKAAHILRRAVGNFDKDQTSDSFKSAMTSFDILVNFTGLPVQSLKELHDNLDDLSNGMLLEGNAKEAFDGFCWCLKPTDTEHVYALKIFRRKGLLRKPKDNLVTFEDHSDEFASGSTGARKRKRTIPLPNPHYIAIHAAIAGVLHMSGAGKFFDELLDEYKDDEDEVHPIRSWLDLEKVMDGVRLRESVEASFQSVQVR